ncbi:uncharacterized protein C13orf46 homolog [Globicephala melas]|uniref:uncharacterized protein C13orf46 homolog n=1 Tax=Globicephala melas TaxID=9731 RepID=UPI00293D8E27|nr:uncharacterized protein C13orf46 homolog [Globicephala melas]
MGGVVEWGRRELDDMPVMTGEVPLATDMIPLMTGVVPLMTGEVPQMTGEVPLMTGVIPLMTAVVPLTTGRLEKDTTAAHRRHQLGPGAPPSAVSPGHLKAASGMAELQRSRCVGGLHQKGDPPSCIKTLCKELEPEGHGKDLRSDTEDARCQASPEEQRQDAAGQVRGRWKEAEPEASGQEEPDGREGADKRALEAKEGEPESVQLGDLLEKEKPSVFVEVDLGDGSEEVITCAMKEEKQSQMDMGDLSEDEIETSWVCCIPYSTRKKVEESS